MTAIFTFFIYNKVLSLRDFASLSSLFLSLEEDSNFSNTKTGSNLPVSMLLPANTIANLDIMPKNVKGKKERVRLPY